MTTLLAPETAIWNPDSKLLREDDAIEFQRVLLIEDDADDATLVKSALSKDTGFQLRVEQTLASGQRSLESYQPHVILLDLTLPDSTGFDSFVAIHRVSLNVPVVVLTGVGSEAMATRIVRAGAEDYLVKGNFDQRSLTRVLRHAIERHARSRTATVEMGKVVGFLGATGGCGTTTAAINVSFALAQLGVKATHVELSGTGISAAYKLGAMQVAGALPKVPPERITDTMIESKLCRLAGGARFLFRPQLADGWDELEAAQVESLIQAAAMGAAITILDLPSNPSPMVNRAARRCDRVIVVLDRDASSMHAASLSLKRLRSWGLENKRLAALIVNRSGLASAPSIPEIELNLGCELFGVVPPSADYCAVAAKHNVPLVASEVECLAADTLRNLANRLRSL